MTEVMWLDSNNIGGWRPDITLIIRQKCSGAEHRIVVKPTMEFSMLKRNVAMLYGLRSRDDVLLFMEKAHAELPLQEEYGYQSIEDMGIEDGDELGTLAVDAECSLAYMGDRCQICDERVGVENVDWLCHAQRLYQCGRCGIQPVCESCINTCDKCYWKACRRCWLACRPGIRLPTYCACRTFFLTNSRQLFADL